MTSFNFRVAVVFFHRTLLFFGETPMSPLDDSYEDNAMLTDEEREHR
jgi:hypothetical protein